MAKKAAPKLEKPKHDDEKYGDVLFSLSYDLDGLNYFNATELVGSGRFQQFFPVISMALLLTIIMSLHDTEHPIYPAAIVAIVAFIALSTLYSNMTKARDWYVSKSTLGLPGDPARHVVVTADTIVVEGPGETVSTYAISEVKTVTEDENGALAKLGGRRYVYIPRKSLSDTRYTALLKLLRSH